jgi:hypothetical protein
VQPGKCQRRHSEADRILSEAHRRPIDPVLPPLGENGFVALCEDFEILAFLRRKESRQAGVEL